MADSFPPHQMHMRREESSLPGVSRQPRSGLARGVLLGLLPFFLTTAALLVLALGGYQCGIVLVNAWIWVSLLLWSGELLTGIIYLVRRKARRFAIGLVITLLVSALLSIPLVFLSAWFVAHGIHPLCSARSGMHSSYFHF